MANKRLGTNFKFIQPEKKIPKLDISIVNNDSTSSKAHALKRVSAKEPVQQPFLKLVSQSLSKQTNSDDMWGDDDDDEFIILAASQLAEKVETFGQDIIVNSMDLSFMRFSYDKKAAESTQKVPLIKSATDDILKAFHDDNDDDEAVFSELPDIEHDYIDKHIDDYVNKQQLTPQLENVYVDMPGPSSRIATIPQLNANSQLNKRELNLQNRMEPNSEDSLTNRKERNTENIQKNISSTIEKQMKFLSKQLEEHKRKLERLQTDNANLSERCQTKDGEVSKLTTYIFKIEYRVCFI